MRLLQSKRALLAFSLVEVVVAIGVVSFAIVAILGVFPIGLKTARSSGDETRAAQIAQDILTSLAGQAPTRYATSSPPSIIQPSGFQYNVPLDRDFTYGLLGAENDGTLKANYTNQPYQITLSTKASPPGFDPGYACQVTVRVAWRPFNQNYRDYVRIISKY